MESISFHLMLTAIGLLAALLDVTTLFLLVHLLCYRWPRPWLIRLDSAGAGLTQPLLRGIQRICSKSMPLREPAKVLIAVLMLWMARSILSGIWAVINKH